jgi:hypothetical protein
MVASNSANNKNTAAAAALFDSFRSSVHACRRRRHPLACLRVVSLPQPAVHLVTIVIVSRRGVCIKEIQIVYDRSELAIRAGLGWARPSRAEPGGRRVVGSVVCVIDSRCYLWI